MNTTIMKQAHITTRETVKKFGGDYKATFAIALKQIYGYVKNKLNVTTYFENIKKAWAKMNEQKTGIITVHYAEYKNKYSHLKTVYNSYNKITKTIQVILDQPKQSVPTIKNDSTFRPNKINDGWCRHCQSYCYGDCEA